MKPILRREARWGFEGIHWAAQVVQWADRTICSLTFIQDEIKEGQNTWPFPFEIAVFVEGFACFIRMDLLQMANTCGLQDGKSFNFNGNFNWKRPGVLDLNKKWSWDKNQVAYCILGTYTVLGH